MEPVTAVEASWNVTTRSQKPNFVFRRNGRVHLNRRGRQFSRLLAAEMCASAVVMLDTPYSEVVWRVLATHSIRQFPLQFPSRASPCAISFQLDCTCTGLQFRQIELLSSSVSVLQRNKQLEVRSSFLTSYCHYVRADRLSSHMHCIHFSHILSSRSSSPKLHSFWYISNEM